MWSLVAGLLYGALGWSVAILLMVMLYFIIFVECVDEVVDALQ